MVDRNQKENQTFTEEEQEQRDKLLRRLLKTPPKPRPKRDRKANTNPTENDEK